MIKSTVENLPDLNVGVGHWLVSLVDLELEGVLSELFFHLSVTCFLNDRVDGWEQLSLP